MSAENVEIVRRMCEAYARGDWAAAAEPLDPEIVWDASTSPHGPIPRPPREGRCARLLSEERQGGRLDAYPDRESALAAINAG